MILVLLSMFVSFYAHDYRRLTQYTTAKAQDNLKKNESVVPEEEDYTQTRKITSSTPLEAVEPAAAPAAPVAPVAPVKKNNWWSI